MGNANAAQEPSMEEILASIRQIISEEGVADAHDRSDGDAPPARPRERPALRVAEKPRDTTPPGQGNGMKQNGASTDRGNYAAPALHEGRPTRAEEDEHDDRLLSDGADHAVSSSFSALAHTILAQNARTLEDLVSEMLRPMLREWLDDNLPTLVERVVQEEIQRVSRGRR